MKKIGQPYLDQGKMWQNVEFELGDKVPEGSQFFDTDLKWTISSSYEKWAQKAPSVFKRRIPVENKVQENAKKNLHLLEEMLLHSVKIVRRDGDCANVVSYPTDLLKDGEFFAINGETYKCLTKDRAGQDKYAIFEALAEGKTVQFRSPLSCGGIYSWEDFTSFYTNCHFDAPNHLYRIKPEEIPDTTIKWNSVTEVPDRGRRIHILYKDGDIITVPYNGTPLNAKGWSYVDGVF